MHVMSRWTHFRRVTQMKFTSISSWTCVSSVLWLSVIYKSTHYNVWPLGQCTFFSQDSSHSSGGVGTCVRVFLRAVEVHLSYPAGMSLFKHTHNQNMNCPPQYSRNAAKLRRSEPCAAGWHYWNKGLRSLQICAVIILGPLRGSGRLCVCVLFAYVHD